MPRIQQVGYDEAEGLLEELYGRYARDDGELDEIIRVHSLNPRSMEGHVRYYAHVVKGPSPLSRARREMIAVAVSAANDCYYCVNHHGESLRRLTGTDRVARALVRDPAGAELEPAERAMIDFALALTRNPGAVGEAETNALREAGFGDRELLDICQVASYFNYVNRMATGLGVELEPYWNDELRVVSAEEFEAWRGGGG